jgi:hypothetical protein
MIPQPFFAHHYSIVSLSTPFDLFSAEAESLGVVDPPLSPENCSFVQRASSNRRGSPLSSHSTSAPHSLAVLYCSTRRDIPVNQWTCLSVQRWQGLLTSHFVKFVRGEKPRLECARGCLRDDAVSVSETCLGRTSSLLKLQRPTSSNNSFTTNKIFTAPPPRQLQVHWALPV